MDVVWNCCAVILADDAAPPAGGGLESLMSLLPMIIVIVLLYQLIIARPQRKEQAKRDELLKSLKKNDPVVTIGGIIGTVVSVTEDGTEITVKVDDNTRMRFRRDAIRDVLRKDEPEKAAAPKAADAK